jgi:hypothetical protein
LQEGRRVAGVAALISLTAPAAWATPAPGRTVTSTGTPTGWTRGPERSASVADDVARVALAPARALTWLLFAPPRATTWAIDELALVSTARGLFFDDTGTYGAFPIVGIETPFGVSLGARAVHRSAFGAGESLDLSAAYGGRLNQRYAVSMATGRRFRPVTLRLRAKYETLPRLVYEGLHGARGPSSAVSVETLAGEVGAGFALDERTRVGLVVAAWSDAFGPPGRRSDEPFAGDLYTLDPFSLAEGSVETGAVGLEFRYDGGEVASPTIPPARPTSGPRIRARLDARRVLEADPATYLRYAIEAEQRLDLFLGRRTLALRLLALGVGGAEGRVPVFDLARLGGPNILRGYARGALRGRHALALVLAYRFPLVAGLGGLVFAEAGQVYRTVEDLSDLPEASAGLGFEVFRWERIFGRLQVAVSRRGGLQLTFGGTVRADLDGRWDR